MLPYKNVTVFERVHLVKHTPLCSKNYCPTQQNAQKGEVTLASFKFIFQLFMFTLLRKCLISPDG